MPITLSIPSWKNAGHLKSKWILLTFQASFYELAFLFTPVDDIIFYSDIKNYTFALNLVPV